MRMFLVIVCTLTMLVGAVWAFDWSGFTFDENQVADHEGLIATCAATFGTDAIERIVTQLRLEQQGAGGFDTEGVTQFARDYLASACDTQDCSRPSTQVRVCAQLTGYAIVPF